MTRKSLGSLVALVGVVLFVYWGPPALAQTAPSLGSAQSFAVLGGTAVTAAATGTVITGDVGVSPGTSITGFPAGATVVPPFATHANDAAAIAAQSSTTSLYTTLAGTGGATAIAAELGGTALGPGVYSFTSTANIAAGTTLTLNGAGVYIFKVGSALTANVGSTVLLNGASACNVFWQVTSAATLNGVSFPGTVVAQAGVTLGVGAALTGRALTTSAGAVTLSGGNTVGGCSSAAGPSPVCPVITLSPSTLPGGTVGVAYSQTIAGNGGTAPYTFAVTTGSLPPGLTLTAAGVLAGTPTSAGTSTVTIRGTDANGCSGTAPYTIVIAAAPPPPAVCPAILLAPITLLGGTVGVAATATLTGSGGTAPYTFGVISGALPAGVTLTAAGVLSGTPTVAGTNTFTIRVTDANGCFASLPYTVVIAAAPVPPAVCPVITIPQTTLPNMAIGVAYSTTITSTGGATPYGFGLIAGALPAGMTLTAAGVLSGTPTTAGTSTFTIRSTDANGCFASVDYTVVIPAVAVPVPTLPQVFVVLLALGLTALGFLRLRRPARVE